jgi:hypothetical protein
MLVVFLFLVLSFLQQLHLLLQILLQALVNLSTGNAFDDCFIFLLDLQ